MYLNVPDVNLTTNCSLALSLILAYLKNAADLARDDRETHKEQDVSFLLFVLLYLKFMIRKILNIARIMLQHSFFVVVT